jgi:Ca2+-binding RTX toxin-like protein
MAIINGTPGNDRNLIGTAEVDTISGLAGNDLIEGRGGVISGGGGLPQGDMLFGGDGIDTLSYWSSPFGVEVMLGANGIIQFAGFGHAASDTGDGFENLLGSAHDDILTGNGGDNVIEGAGGADEMHGGAGNDTLSYSRAPVAVFVALKNGAIDIALDLDDGGHAGGDTGDGFSNILGSAFSDQLIGDMFDNIIRGRNGRDDIRGGDGDHIGGKDRLFGGGGDDTLYGGPGAELHNGGPGRDLLSYIGSPDSIQVMLGENGRESIGIGSHAEDDRIVKVEDVGGSEFADLLKGNEKGNRLSGWGGNDTISGRGGNDSLGGVAGADVLYGGGGDDNIFGGAGKDLMEGGGGNDRFFFTESLASGNVGRILDFESGKDVMELRKSVFVTIPSGKLKASAFQVGAEADDVKDRIIHKRKTGEIFFDVDGKGGEDQVLFAKVSKGLKVAAEDFFVA